jgi:acyl carrier protein
MDVTPSTEIRSTVLTVVRKHLKYLPGEESLAPEDELDRLGLDSQSAISLLLELEQAFSIMFPDELLTVATFRTPQSLEEAVRSLIPGQDA